MNTFAQRLRRSLEFAGLLKSKQSEAFARWYADQGRLLESGKEIEPPWIAFPHNDPVGGWNQGYNEAWKCNVWMPFWSGSSDDERDAYLEQRQPPSEDWRQTLIEFWARRS